MKKITSSSLILVSCLYFIITFCHYLYNIFTYRSFNHYRFSVSLWNFFNLFESLLTIVTIVLFSIIVLSYTKYNKFVLIPGILYIVLSIIGSSSGTPIDILSYLAVLPLIIAFIMIKPWIRTSYTSLMVALIANFLAIMLSTINFFNTYVHWFFIAVWFIHLLFLIIYTIFITLFLRSYMKESHPDSNTSYTVSEAVELDSLGKIGAILTIIGNIIGLIISILMTPFLATYSRHTMGYSIFLPLISLSLIFNTLSVRANIYFLKGQFEQKISAVIFGVLSGSFIGSILVAISQPEGESTSLNLQPNQNNEHQIIDQLYKYKQLLDDQLITEEEYNELKKKLLREIE